jgi:hypothetical protein
MGFRLLKLGMNAQFAPACPARCRVRISLGSARFWSASWQDLGGPIGSAPAVAAWGSNRLDVFAAGSDGNLQHKWWDGANWGAWDWVGGYFQGNPAAVSWGPNRLDVFAWGNTQHLGHLWMK